MSDKYEELEKLQSLKEREIISEEEFQREKDKILNSPEKTKVEFKNVVSVIKNKRVIFLIIAAMLIIISLFFHRQYGIYGKEYRKVAERQTTTFLKMVELERSDYYSQSEYDRLSEKYDELEEKCQELSHKRLMADIGFNICVILAVVMCFVHAILFLKGNGLGKKEFIKKLVLRMIIPVAIAILMIMFRF